MKTTALKAFLENQYLRYHRAEYLQIDPLICLDPFNAAGDTEIAALVASVLAYGRAEIIIRNVRELFRITGLSLREFAVNTSLDEKRDRFRGFKHRFNDGTDMAILLHSVGAMCRKYGSLELLFSAGSTSHDPTVKIGLENFTRTVKQHAFRLMPQRAKSVGYLLPSPSSGSACKRLNMYLRWMVRKNDGIDLGIWKKIDPARLIIPVDTHVARLARELGLTARGSADWRMAEEITAGLRKCDAADPIRYDFSLCRSGMVDFRRRAA